MEGMENANFEENKSEKVKRDQTEAQSGLGQTLPIPIREVKMDRGDSETNQSRPQSDIGSELGATIPTRISQPENGLPDLNATIPVTIRLESDEQFSAGETMPTTLDFNPENPSGFEATIPPPELASSAGEGPPSFQKNGSADQLPPKNAIRMILLFGFLGLFLIAALSAFSGYQSGINARRQAESTAKALRAKEQYDLALQDLQSKDYARARQRFEYVIELEPNFPGVTDKLAEALLELSITATPTYIPTPTLTPTPDTRSEDQLFAQAGESLYNKDWNVAIDTALALRKSKPDFKAVQVDGILYVAYRNRGSDKILKEGDLEGGIYDLSLAERFAPLDADAKSYITWARLYILGASFWDVDWSQAVYYFGQVAPALPNLRDATGWTATERYRLSLIGYGDALANRKEWCQAAKQYEQALAYAANPEVQTAYARAVEKCEGPKQQPTPEPQGETPAPTEMAPPEESPTVPSP